MAQAMITLICHVLICVFLFFSFAIICYELPRSTNYNIRKPVMHNTSCVLLCVIVCYASFVLMCYLLLCVLNHSVF